MRGSASFVLAVVAALLTASLAAPPAGARVLEGRLGPSQASAQLASKKTVTLGTGRGPTFHLPPGTVARSLAIAQGGTIWAAGERFPELHHQGTGVIMRLADLGRLTTYALGHGRALPFSEHDLAVGPEGDLFFGELHATAGPLGVDRSAIGRLSPSGRFAQFDLGAGAAEVGSLATGPDGNLWFTLGYRGDSRPGRWVGRMTPDGAATRFRVSGAPGQIVGGPDRAVWFTDADGEDSALGRISPSGEVTYVPLGGFAPTSLALGWDDSFWVTSATEAVGGNELAHVTPSGQVTLFAVPGKNGTDAIARGPEGDMWFSVWGYPRFPMATKIDSITAAGLAAVPTCLDRCEMEPLALATWPDGSLILAGGRTLDEGGGGGSGLTSLEDQRSTGGTLGQYRPSPAAVALEPSRTYP
jgi:virginiamycin B lyase